MDTADCLKEAEKCERLADECETVIGRAFFKGCCGPLATKGTGGGAQRTVVAAFVRRAELPLMAELVAVGAVGFLLAATGLYFRRREPSRSFLVCAVLGISLAIANLLIRMS